MTPPLNLPAPGRCQAIFVILTISHSHMFLVNSRLGHFSAPASPRDPLSLSYGVNLPSSLAVIHSSASLFSTRPRVSVDGTGAAWISLADFLGSMVTSILPRTSTRYTLRFGSHGGFAYRDQRLHSLTTQSVGSRKCHCSVSASLLKVVTEC